MMESFSTGRNGHVVQPDCLVLEGVGLDRKVQDNARQDEGNDLFVWGLMVCLFYMDSFMVRLFYMDGE
jgi:hypothetical protein